MHLDVAGLEVGVQVVLELLDRLVRQPTLLALVDEVVRAVERHAHADDARRFLQRSGEKYDLIFGDAYNGVRHIPAHLVTREFFDRVKSHLTPDGVIYFTRPQNQIARLIATGREVLAARGVKDFREIGRAHV